MKAAVVGWHRCGWQCLSWGPRVGGMPRAQTFPAHCSTATNKKHFCSLSKHVQLQHQAISELCSLLGALGRGSRWVYCSSCDLTSSAGSLLCIFLFSKLSVKPCQPIKVLSRTCVLISSHACWEGGLVCRLVWVCLVHFERFGGFFTSTFRMWRSPQQAAGAGGHRAQLGRISPCSVTVIALSTYTNQSVVSKS